MMSGPKAVAALLRMLCLTNLCTAVELDAHGLMCRQEAENEEAAWDPEWVKAYARLEEEYRSRDERQSAGSFQYTGRAGDHL